jgi:hypothetical protein
MDTPVAMDVEMVEEVLVGLLIRPVEDMAVSLEVVEVLLVLPLQRVGVKEQEEKYESGHGRR